MDAHAWRASLARYGAPVVFLAAATAAALLIRSGLKSGNDAASAGSTVTSSVSAKQRAYYRVKSGDTLGVVAERFNTTLDDLVALNPQIDPNSLKIGERLRIH